MSDVNDSAESDHPDLIDCEGERWRWTTGWQDGDGYQCADLFCLHSRGSVEQHFGPVTEVHE